MSSQVSGHIKSTIGANVKWAREARGWTQLQLASRIGVDPVVISRWERGKNRPSDAYLAAAAIALDRPEDWFYVDHSEEAARA